MLTKAHGSAKREITFHSHFLARVHIAFVAFSPFRGCAENKRNENIDSNWNIKTPKEIFKLALDSNHSHVAWEANPAHLTHCGDRWHIMRRSQQEVYNVVHNMYVSICMLRPVIYIRDTVTLHNNDLAVCQAKRNGGDCTMSVIHTVHAVHLRHLCLSCSHEEQYQFHCISS